MLSDQDKIDTLEELFDSQKVNIRCGTHNYFGPIKGRPEIIPVERCADCWKVWFISELATTPPSERRQKLDEIEEVLHNMIQMVENGTWDLKLYPHAQIEIGKE